MPAQDFFTIELPGTFDGAKLLQIIQRDLWRKKPNLAICEQQRQTFFLKALDNRFRNAIQGKVSRVHPVNPRMGHSDEKNGARRQILDPVLQALRERRARTSDGDHVGMQAFWRILRADCLASV